MVTGTEPGDGIWKTMSRPMRFTVVGFSISGALLSIAGILGDEYDWWTDRPFLTNLSSSVTGACFGIPVALVLLKTLSEGQARFSERIRNSSRAVRAVQYFCFTSQHNLLIDFRTFGVFTDLRDLFIALRALYETPGSSHLAINKLLRQIESLASELPADTLMTQRLAYAQSWERVKAAVSLPQSGLEWFFSVEVKAGLEEFTSFIILPSSLSWITHFQVHREIDGIPKTVTSRTVEPTYKLSLAAVDYLDRLLRAIQLIRTIEGGINEKARAL